MGGVQQRDPLAWLRGRAGTVSQWCHTVLKGQQAPGGGSQWLSITNSLHELTASIRSCGRGLGGPEYSSSVLWKPGSGEATPPGRIPADFLRLTTVFEAIVLSVSMLGWRACHERLSWYACS